MNKVKIELSATTALNILGFLKEWQEDLKSNPECQMMAESVEEFEEQVESKITTEQFEDAVMEITLATLMGKAPDNAKGGSIFKKG